jgi:hypothetical protein
MREPRRFRSLSSSVSAIGPGRPTRGRRLPSGGEEQTERREQDEGGNRPAKDLETHRATSFSGLTVLWSVFCSRRQRSRGRTTRSSTRATGAWLISLIRASAPADALKGDRDEVRTSGRRGLVTWIAEEAGGADAGDGSSQPSCLHGDCGRGHSRSAGARARGRRCRLVRLGGAEGWAGGQGRAGAARHSPPHTAGTLSGKRSARSGRAVRGVRAGCARLAALGAACTHVESGDRGRRRTATWSAAARPLSGRAANPTPLGRPAFGTRCASRRCMSSREPPHDLPGSRRRG